MYSYVHQDLIPELLMKAKKMVYLMHGNECPSSKNIVVEGGASMITSDFNEVEITPALTQPLKDVFLQTYGLRTLGITTIARWMHAASEGGFC